jgi:hypothetical protein
MTSGLSVDRDLVRNAEAAIEALSDALTLYKTGADVASRFGDDKAAAVAIIGEMRLKLLLGGQYGS